MSEAIPQSEFNEQLWRRQIIEDLTGLQLVKDYLMQDVQLEFDYK